MKPLYQLGFVRFFSFYFWIRGKYSSAQQRLMLLKYYYLCKKL
ncbi:hypothetical protein [uncultured Gammaproteobacteria bacterium]|nr:hypothetical protein [uncultured Gammaproteobacteria bacterium]